MPAYWVARSKINYPVEYKKYTDLVPGIIAKYGGKVLARGGRFQIMEGPHKFQRFVVIEFPTFEQGVACFTSKEYDEAAAFRRSGAGEVETIMVDGGKRPNNRAGRYVPTLPLSDGAWLAVRRRHRHTGSGIVV